MALSSFEEILVVVSGLATNGCFFLGEFPARFAETNMGTEVTSLNSQMEFK